MKRISACRSCGASELVSVLDLGRVPLANALVSESELDAAEPRFPLTLVFCPRCTLVQILETVAPEQLFRHYYYFSSFSDTMVEHARQVVEKLTERLQLGPQSLVVEIASNDGYLLRHFVARGIPVLGIDPARNVAEAAQEAGVPTLCEFFGAELAGRLAGQGRRAELIIANNVLAHVADTNGFVAGIATLLAAGGTAVIEVPYLARMIEQLEFDTIYHEHLCYFSFHAAQALFARHGLRVVDVEQLTIHGGSLRLSLGHAATAADVSPTVSQLAEVERRRGIPRGEYYDDFAARAERLKLQLMSELRARKASGQRLAAYGASAKGSTLMNYTGIDGSLIDFVADRSTVKQGHYTPGNHLPIVAAEALLERQPDAVLLLTWNFANEIFRQQAEYLRRGGEFIVPIPELRVVGREVVA
ncbi:MAG: class I SAM-dependent methyltransferase [Acidobacteriota bacterium]|nr:MAG: class I SAM-dependent methyltransferase [Acidobacteriota bacterium]